MRTNTTYYLIDGNTKNYVAFVSAVGHVTKRVKTQKQLFSFSSFLHTPPEWVSYFFLSLFFFLWSTPHTARHKNDGVQTYRLCFQTSSQFLSLFLQFNNN